MEEKIRVLHVFKCLAQGGIQSFIMNVYRNIDRDKIQFDFLMEDDGFFDEEVLKMGGKIYKINSLEKVRQFAYKKELENFFNTHKEYKIVHSHYNQTSGVILEVAKKCGIPVRISHSHNIGNSNNFIVKMYKSYLQSKIPKNATHLFACSDLAAEWLFKKSAKDAIIVNNGIDIEKFKYSEEKNRKIREELGISNDTMVIGNIARFATQKNHVLLIDIFNEYQKINSNSVLLLVGEGILQKDIEEKVNSLGLKEKVKFLGVRGDVDYLYSAFDSFVFPSLYEGLGITLIEAQAAGLKTLTSKDVVPVATKVTDLLEFISLNEPASIWAQKISKNDKDRQASNNELLDTSYNIMKVVEQLEKFYEEVL